jgi:hypothetical protein
MIYITVPTIPPTMANTTIVTVRGRFIEFLNTPDNPPDNAPTTPKITAAFLSNFIVLSSNYNLIDSDISPLYS